MPHRRVGGGRWTSLHESTSVCLPLLISSQPHAQTLPLTYSALLSLCSLHFHNTHTNTQTHYSHTYAARHAHTHTHKHTHRHTHTHPFLQTYPSSDKRHLPSYA